MTRGWNFLVDKWRENQFQQIKTFRFFKKLFKEENVQDIFQGPSFIHQRHDSSVKLTQKPLANAFNSLSKAILEHETLKNIV